MLKHERMSAVARATCVGTCQSSPHDELHRGNPPYTCCSHPCTTSNPRFSVSCVCMSHLFLAHPMPCIFRRAVQPLCIAPVKCGFSCYIVCSCTIVHPPCKLTVYRAHGEISGHVYMSFEIMSLITTYFAAKNAFSQVGFGLPPSLWSRSLWVKLRHIAAHFVHGVMGRD